MSDWCDPWHTLVVTVKHFHEHPECPGHDKPQDEGDDTLSQPGTEPEIEKELTHPDDCKDLRNFCAADNPNRCPECIGGNRDGCLGSTGFNYRCMTEHDINEYYDYAGGPTESGTYRVRASGSGPDYWGEYDQETEFEPVEAVNAS